MLTRWFSESQSPDAVRVHRTTWNDEGWTWFKKSQSPDAVRVHRTTLVIVGSGLKLLVSIT